jgi:Histidine phosphatase superfamily (branch 2)
MSHAPVSVRCSFILKYRRTVGGCARLSSTFGSSAGAGSSREEDWEKNSGIIEGVWVFVRHGDRAPSRSLSPPHKVGEETQFWLQKLPRPDSMGAFQEFSRYFPPDIHHSNNGQFLDVKRAPFGFLTHTGVVQTRELGSRLFNRYNRHGYRQRSVEGDHYLSHAEYSQRHKRNYRSAFNFMEAWDMNVYSTNYLRTIMSAQSFLDGLLGTQCYSSLGELQRRNFTGGDHECANNQEPLRVPNHGSFSYEENEALLKVRVRGPDEDTLNAFDRAPGLMAELVSDVISSAEFQERDGAAAPSAARLANILPGLARKRSNTSGFNAAPSGINW